MKFVIAYVPVIQLGYVRFFEQHKDANRFFVLGSDVLSMFDWLRKDLRALPPEEAAEGLRTILRSQKIPVDVDILDTKKLQKLFNPKKDRLIVPDEEIMHILADQFWSDFVKNGHLEFFPVFLRYDKQKTTQQNVIESDKKMAFSDFSRKMMAEAQKIATRSADWWRQVGAVLIKNDAVILSAFNQHVPDQYQTLFQGDPRGNFHKGVNIELTTAFHAEAAVIAEAARQGISLEGTELYVTTFPCPNCAKLIAYSGIKRLYFQEGYAMVDGESILKEKGVEIVHVE
ncbi:deoxycytidylate deaminase [Patescibacteria group bacterium]|nr:deoxycytidylate deaminase [Patescibacteria group bacterium]